MRKLVPSNRPGPEQHAPAEGLPTDLESESGGLAATVAHAIRVGRRQAADLLDEFVTTVEWMEIGKVKKTGSFKGMRWSVAGTLHVIRTWREYVELVLGMELSKVDQTLLNLNAFGDALFDRLNVIGMGRRQMRELRAIPIESRDRLLEVADTGDVNAIKDVLEDLLDGHAKEKAELQAAASIAAEKHERELNAARRLSEERYAELARIKKAAEERNVPTPAAKLVELGDALGLAMLKFFNGVNACGDIPFARRQVDQAQLQFVMEASQFGFRIDLRDVAVSAEFLAQYGLDRNPTQPLDAGK